MRRHRRSLQVGLLVVIAAFVASLFVFGATGSRDAGDPRDRVATVNGETGLCVRDGNRLIATMSIATDGQRILAIYAVVNPDKLK